MIRRVACRPRVDQGWVMRIVYSILLLLFFVPDWMGEDRLALFGPHPSFRVHRVMLDPSDPARRRVGDLVWLDGVQLSSSDEAFGGFSAMHVAGERMTLLSDGGNIVSFRMDGHGTISNAHFSALPDGPGTGWEKADRDSESLAVDPKTGKNWVGFENFNQIWRYSPDFTRVEAHSRPPAMRGWYRNGGAESMTLLPQGGMIVIRETDPWRGGIGRAAIRFLGDASKRPRYGYCFSYMPPDGYDPSDMTVLPDGMLLVLNRRFDPPFDFTAKLTVVDPSGIAPWAVVQGREIATFESPLIHDNFEGVSITREKGATIVWLVSDDNQSILQRTLLLKFRLEPDPRAAPAKPVRLPPRPSRASCGRHA